MKDIKDFINISNLYTEVDFEKNKKVEEGFIDWVKDKLGIDDESAAEDLDNLLQDLPTKTKKDLDKAADKSTSTGQDNNPNTDGGQKTTPVVTTQDQANSIFQNPNATDAERKAAQDFYNANKDDTSTVGDDPSGAGDDGVAQGQDNNPNTDGGQDRDSRQGQDNNPNTDGGQAATSTGQDNNPNTGGTDSPEQPETPAVDTGAPEPTSSPETDPNVNTTAPEKPVTPGGEQEPGPEIDTADPSKQGIDGPSNAAAMAAGQAGAASATAPSNGSLLGRKLDTTTPNLMKAYNDGGKKAMPAIKNMQTALSRLGFDPNGIDGKYGNGTYSAVQAFQKANGLSVDGQAGPNTMAAIKKALDDNFEKNKVTPDAQTALPADQDQSPEDGAEPEQTPKSAQASNDAQAAQDKADADAKDDPMTAANQQKDIDTAQPNADLDRYIELLNKLEGGQVNAGTPNATQGQVFASYDFRDLMTLVESKLLNEKLTPAEMEELKALHNKVQGHVGIDAELDTKITAALNRYLKLVKEPADKADAQTKASDRQLIAKGQAAKADAQNKASDAQLIAKAQSAEPKVSKESYIQMAPNRNASLANFNVSKMKAKYPKPYVDMPQADGTVHRGYGPLANLENFVKNNPKLKAKIVGKPVQQAGTPNAERDAAERGVQTASKDNNMKKAIKEASMNISINGDSAAEVAELAGILKNAGMHDAKPVSDIMPHADNSHDDMMSKMAIVNEPEMDAPCGMDEEGVEEDWDNSPDESYADTQTMTKDLSGGLNRQKKSYPKVADGDNPMAVETSIREQLWAALNEKMTAEGRGRGKTLKASRGEKLNASRGNKLMASRGKDKKTTEGSRGKKSRGKKSRG